MVLFMVRLAVFVRIRWVSTIKVLGAGTVLVDTARADTARADTAKADTARADTAKADTIPAVYRFSDFRCRVRPSVV